MKKLITVIILLFGLIACNGSGGDTTKNDYLLHENITSTVFWVGEAGTEDNEYISNYASVWDSLWLHHYGGVDSPDNRSNYYPAKFIPKENPFYVALPYNDFDENGERKPESLQIIPWAYSSVPDNVSLCKNRWVKIIKGDKVAYAQWEDAGPFGEDDADYVFGNALPQNTINNNAGIDVSPAVRDYLGLSDIDKVSWQFVDASDVPDGPWKNIITTSQITWVDWYKPQKGIKWYLQLNGSIDVNNVYPVNLYDIDLFDNSEDIITALHNKGIKVVCYFSAGTYEDWREDATSFPSDAIGNALPDWPGEYWLDIRNSTVREIMKARLDLAVEKGCDAVDPDNVDGYSNNTGFDLTYQDQLDYNEFLSYEAHKRGLGISLKNDMAQIPDLEPFFDFALNEECYEFGECGYYEPFLIANKAVLNVEYNTLDNKTEICNTSSQLGISTIFSNYDLDGTFIEFCE